MREHEESGVDRQNPWFAQPGMITGDGAYCMQWAGSVLFGSE